MDSSTPSQDDRLTASSAANAALESDITEGTSHMPVPGSGESEPGTAGAPVNGASSSPSRFVDYGNPTDP